RASWRRQSPGSSRVRSLVLRGDAPGLSPRVRARCRTSIEVADDTEHRAEGAASERRLSRRGRALARAGRERSRHASTLAALRSGPVGASFDALERLERTRGSQFATRALAVDGAT